MAYPLSVLVVDDDPGLTETLSDILEEEGYEVEVAHNGFEAIEKASSHLFDCILMDIRMPGMNGVEAFKEIKRISPETPVVMMTAYSLYNLIEEARQEGALAVLPKPLDINKILGSLEEMREPSPLLIVDDDPSFCQTLRDCLEEKGYRVACATDGHEAIDLVSRSRYSAVFLDMKLKGLNGMDTFVAIREIDPRVAVILITGYTNGGIKKELEGKSAYRPHRVLFKPFAVEEILNLLSDLRRERFQKNLQARISEM
ncbi:MAG: response regulator [Candidatus Tectomicrobia bacterium]|uniref:Response regulator n=1 Tax=Tectimicrobiota bacterium TaxID=2528274 RepID=A0A932CN98_UNCTE|nr:response regulator [Candidatus Tectomicrobia bacterium]